MRIVSRARPKLGSADAEAPNVAGGSLRERIDSLDPWFYPLKIRGETVTPGVGSGLDVEWLSNRVKYRQTLMVDEVVKRHDLRGKSMLELACNCAYWSSRYVGFGVNRVVGVEGRPRHAEQARLYLTENEILPKDAFEIIDGNVLDPAVWAVLRSRAPFDVTMCAGILYHLPEYRQLLAWIASVTTEAMIIDTRVTHGPEQLVEEPGELYFNAIKETRNKIVPNIQLLIEAIRAVGFSAEWLRPGFGSPRGLQDVDDYSRGHRVTLYCRKVSFHGA
jgi:hypothetical protein